MAGQINDPWEKSEFGVRIGQAVDCEPTSGNVTKSQEN
jgi:hypothetical protein